MHCELYFFRKPIAQAVFLAENWMFCLQRELLKSKRRACPERSHPQSGPLCGLSFFSAALTVLQTLLKDLCSIT